ncbi:MAG: LysM peptidoglycan-binding domain-containing protein [Oscillospiraceae bacterium]|nr:LysM peptidoglycan-binding domain-containing protein [Oscillospiraceae bacterium]
MEIENLDGGKPFTVLYNPQSYSQSRNVHYGSTNMLGSNGPVVQFQNGGAEQVHFDLFFDSLYAGPEVGGGIGDKGAFTVNMMMTDSTNKIDIRDYTKKVYGLMEVQKNVHRPPLLKVKWGSLQFIGFLAQCAQHFTRFDAKGQPVRAILSCTFVECPELNRPSPAMQSPDTTKYRVSRTGDSLWAIADREYGECERWREIARANDIDNPRMLSTGDTIAVPALKD